MLKFKNIHKILKTFPAEILWRRNQFFDLMPELLQEYYMFKFLYTKPCFPGQKLNYPYQQATTTRGITWNNFFKHSWKMRDCVGLCNTEDKIVGLFFHALSHTVRCQETQR